MSDRPTVWRIQCQGGCGRYQETTSVHVLWTAPDRCPDCTGRGGEKR